MNRVPLKVIACASLFVAAVVLACVYWLGRASPHTQPKNEGQAQATNASETSRPRIGRRELRGRRLRQLGRRSHNRRTGKPAVESDPSTTGDRISPESALADIKAAGASYGRRIVRSRRGRPGLSASTNLRRSMSQRHVRTDSGSSGAHLRSNFLVKRPKELPALGRQERPLFVR